MEPQTQAVSGVGSLDPQAVNLAKAIRQSESGGNFSAHGKSGEYGAYQYTDNTWAKDSAVAGVNVPLKQATPEQQNQVAYTKIKSLKDKGYNIGQTASVWNAGEGEPNAYTGKFSDGSPSVGTNKQGVQFDVPKYAKSVATAYQTLKGGGNVQADPNNPSSVANTQNAQPPDQSPSLGGFLGNVASSGENFLGGIGNAVMHPIQTAENLGNVAIGAGESGINTLTGSNINTDQTKMFGNVADQYKQKYGGLSNIAHTLYTDPVGAAADASVLFGGAGALAGKLGETGRVASTLNKISDVTNPISAIGKVASKASGLVGRGIAAPLGVSTGVGSEAITQGFNAVSKGGDARQAFLSGLRGGANPEELVTQAKDALGQVMEQRSQTYKDMLATLGKDKTTYDISPIFKETDNQLNKFGVAKNADGSLDFSRSKFALDTTAKNDIQNLYNYVKGYGSQTGDRTALGVDNLKQVLGGYYSPNSDYRAFTQAIKNSTRGVLDDAPGYTNEMKAYSNLSDQINETRKALSLGDKASQETAFKKLTSSLKNNDVRKQIIKELDQATGGNLLAKVAGQRMSEIMPRGLAQFTEMGLGGVAALNGMGIVPLLGLFMTSSPRVVGELVDKLGLGISGTSKVMKMLEKFRTPITGAGRINGLIPLNNTQ